MTSDSGVMLLGETDRKLGLIAVLVNYQDRGTCVVPVDSTKERNQSMTTRSHLTLSRLQHLFLALLAALLVFNGGLALAAELKPEAGTIVIGQSLPLTGAWFGQANAIRAATEAAVKGANVAGGVNGQMIELVTLDDQSKPALVAVNMQRLVSQNNAVAIVNCVGDASCRMAATQAVQLKTSLVGAIAGTASVLGGKSPYLIRIRPSYAQESQALLHQLTSMLIKSVAIVRVEADDDEQVRVLEAAFSTSGITSTRYTLSGKTPAAFDALLASIAKGNHQAVFMDVNPSILDAMEAAAIQTRREWPFMVIALASPSTTQLALLMKPRIVGFTSVVPNPERTSLALVQQFQRDVDSYSTPEAQRFEGLEAYINTRLLIEALRKTKSPVNAERLAGSLAGLGKISLGGFVLNLDPARAYASDFLEVGVTSKEGLFLR